MMVDFQLYSGCNTPQCLDLTGFRIHSVEILQKALYLRQKSWTFSQNTVMKKQGFQKNRSNQNSFLINKMSTATTTQMKKKATTKI